MMSTNCNCNECTNLEYRVSPKSFDNYTIMQRPKGSQTIDNWKPYRKHPTSKTTHFKGLNEAKAFVEKLTKGNSIQ